MATHSSILAWKIPGMEEPGMTTVHWAAKSQTWLNSWAMHRLHSQPQLVSPDWSAVLFFILQWLFQTFNIYLNPMYLTLLSPDAASFFLPRKYTPPRVSYTEVNWGTESLSNLPQVSLLILVELGFKPSQSGYTLCPVTLYAILPLWT